MTKLTKILCLIVAPLGILFCLVGYAALSTTLTIDGTAEAKPPNAVFIAEITNITYSRNTSAVPKDGFSGDPTAIDFPSTKFISNIKFGSQGTATFRVKIVNGTSKPQIYNKMKRYESIEGMGTFTYTGINPISYGGKETEPNPLVDPGQGTVIEPGESCIFTVTITNRTYSERTNRMLFEFDFVTSTSELTQMASLAVLAKYDALINNSTAYEKLQDKMESGNGQNGRDNKEGYISNSPDYTAEQKKLINDAFGDTMVLEYQDQKYPITVLLKQQNVCTWNSTNEERMIYFTADPLSAPGTRVAVFVCVFYKENGGGWEPVGQKFMVEGQEYWILEGTATVIDRSGNDGTGNFQTGEWISTKEYFGVGAGATLQQLMNQCRP